MVVNFDRQTYNAELLLPTKLEKLKPGYQIGPLWLRPLLTTKFFDTCEVHGDSNRNECNLYCLDCRGEALCSGCSPQHRDHHVVQIRRSSYHDVVRVSELQKVLDLGGVQTYIINSARVVFLNARPQPRHAKGVTKTCEICDRSLLDTFRYCSLGCKLTGIRRHNDMTFHLPPKNPQPPQQQQQQILEDHHPQVSDDHHGQEQEVSHEQGSVTTAMAAVDHVESPLAPAIPTRSSVVSEETSSGGSTIVGKRTRSSRKSGTTAGEHHIDHHQHQHQQQSQSSRSREEEEDHLADTIAKSTSRSQIPVIDHDTSSIQRSLGTLKLGRPSPSPSPSVSMEEAAAAARVVKSKKPPGSPMAVNSPELSPPTPPPTRTAKRRKGTPHRAPFGSAI
ncbi:uncharacterized protein LOC9660645 [Selaginella moellendorffii]|uniref:uncharacterized protein LOC9660645 n=1 Tax=Selaginella moellendorffii TaxID=88036 RepID=UPI000D1D021C|nr:uncharacterized protein LOC9660645 [Selaginella moellendorffii]|eukprot:XP_024530191.1 uncharacterized protein LOC9660645 [Selaginella moellendorffii]